MIFNDPTLLLLLSVAAVFLLLASGMKIAVLLALCGILGFLVLRGNTGLAFMIPFSVLDSFVLIAVPLFIFMGEILMKSGVSDMVYRGVSKWLAWAPGGLLHSNIGACALFASVSGSSPATAATVGTVAIPQMAKRGYDKRLVLGSITAGGTLGILIPPSITMIIYGWLTSTSVGALFMAGVLPGIMLALMFSLYIVARVVARPGLAPRGEYRVSPKDLVLSVRDLWPILILFVVIFGGIFGGVVTPSEAAAVASAAALGIALALRKFSWQKLRDSLVSAAQTTSMVFFIVVGASILGGFIAQARIPAAVMNSLLAIELPRIVVLLLIYLIYIVLGCFMSVLPILVMTIPITVPVVLALGYDIIWFGVVIVVLAELAMVTPPVGVNLFVVKGISNESLSVVVAGVAPFILVLIAALAILTAFPSIALWLPSLLFPGAPG